MIKKRLEGYNNIATHINYQTSCCGRVSLFKVSLHKNMEDRTFLSATIYSLNYEMM